MNRLVRTLENLGGVAVLLGWLLAMVYVIPLVFRVVHG